jgi:hypothetical protein
MEASDSCNIQVLIDSIRKQTREVIMVNEPVIEAVMIGIQGQTSISFFIAACAVL